MAACKTILGEEWQTTRMFREVERPRVAASLQNGRLR